MQIQKWSTMVNSKLGKDKFLFVEAMLVLLILFSTRSPVEADSSTSLSSDLPLQSQRMVPRLARERSSREHDPRSSLVSLGPFFVLLRRNEADSFRCSCLRGLRYDLNALFTKGFGFVTINVQGLARVSAVPVLESRRRSWESELTRLPAPSSSSGQVPSPLPLLRRLGSQEELRSSTQERPRLGLQDPRRETSDFG